MRIDRYELFEPFATGGMAAVHFGKLFAAAGFQRVVAIKVPHAHVLSDPDFRAMFIDEARIVARIRSPHVVATLDIIEKGETLYQVMEYASGPALSSLVRTTRDREEPIPISIAISIIADTLEGLHAAHEVRDDQGAPLGVVHRDVSPQNILVTEDGVAQVIDFGIAMAAGRQHLTQPGDVKGKASYMSPEQVHGRAVDRRADVYAVGVVLYEVLTSRKPFVGEDFPSTALKHVLEAAPDPRALRDEVSPEMAAIVARALAKSPQERFPTARAMAEALLALPTPRAPAREVAEWLAETSDDFFRARRARIAALPSVGDAGASSASSASSVTSLPSVNDGASLTSEETTRLDAAAPQHAAQPAPPKRRGRMALVALAIVSLLGISGTVALMRSKHRAAETLAPTTTSASSTASAAAPASMAPPAIALAPPSSEPSASSSSAATPRPRPPARGAGGAAGARRAPAVDPAQPSQPAPVQPPCCSGDLRIRVSNCLDNCPSGS